MRPGDENDLWMDVFKEECGGRRRGGLSSGGSGDERTGGAFGSGG